MAQRARPRTRRAGASRRRGWNVRLRRPAWRLAAGRVVPPPRAAARRLAALPTLLLLAAAPAAAGTLTVSNLAAAPGGGDGFGLIVNLTANCPYPNNVTVDSPAEIEGEFGACDTLTASAVTVIGPTVFEAAQQVELGEGFAVGDAAELAVLLGPLDSKLAFVEDDSPSQETTFGAEWQMNLAVADLSSGDLFAVLAGLSAAGGAELEALLTYNDAAMEDRLVLRARLDDGSTSDTSETSMELLLPAGWNSIAVIWAAGPGTGYLLASVDGANFVGLTGLDNDGARIETVRFGAVHGTADGSTGSYFLDEYSSFR